MAQGRRQPSPEGAVRRGSDKGPTGPVPVRGAHKPPMCPGSRFSPSPGPSCGREGPEGCGQQVKGLTLLARGWWRPVGDAWAPVGAMAGRPTPRVRPRRAVSGGLGGRALSSAQGPGAWDALCVSGVVCEGPPPPPARHPWSLYQMGVGAEPGSKCAAPTQTERPTDFPSTASTPPVPPPQAPCSPPPLPR